MKDPHVIGTSASNAAADRLCPGRFIASRNLPDVQSEAASSGTRVHAALAENAREGVNTGTLASLTPDERDMFDSCRDIEKTILMDVFKGEPDQSNKVLREQRFWCRVPDLKAGTGILFFDHSGQADVVHIRKGTALVLDYKTGLLDAVESPKNEQLRDLAVMVARSNGLEDVIVAIIQPLSTWTPELCRYDKAALAQAEQEMWDRVRKSNDPASPRIPGPVQCKYCKATGICKEYAAWSASLLPEKPSPLASAMSAWTPQERAVVAEHLPRLKKLLEDAESHLKSVLQADPEGVPGYYLKPGRFREPITDPQELFTRFSAAGGQLDQFMKCVKITKGDLEDQVRAVTKTKGKALKNEVAKMLEGIVESKQDAPSLARKEEV